MLQEHKNGEESRNQSGFSWTAEKQAVLDSYNKSGRSTDNSSSIFTNREGFANGESYSENGYKYDYPVDNGYVYDPNIYASSSRSGSGIFSDIPKNQQSGANVRYSNSAIGGANRSRSSAEAGRRTPVRQPQANQKSVSRGASSKNRNIQKNRTQESAKVSAAQRRNTAGYEKYAAVGSAKDRNIKSKQRPASQSKKRTLLNFSGNKKAQKRSELARRKEIERLKKERARIVKSNSEYDKARSQGHSADESRLKQVHKKKRSRKFYAVICVAATVIVALCAGLGYCVFYGAPIASIVIEGSVTYKEAEILEAGEISQGDNMLLIRKSKTSRKISKTLPYIESVDVKYEFPDTLKLVINETGDKIQIENGNVIITLDGNDKVLSATKKKLKSGIYRIKGLEKQDYALGEIFVPAVQVDENGNKLKDTNRKKYEIAKEIMKSIEMVGIADCRTIDVSDLKRIAISCGKNLTLYADTNTPFEKRLSTAKYGIDTGKGSGINQYADMRFGDSVIFGTSEPS